MTNEPVMSGDYMFEPTARPPWPQQVKGFERFRNSEIFALFMEQRVGKSRIVVDLAAERFERPEGDPLRIDGLLILAPNGVAGNWARESIPEFLPRRFAAKTVVWRSGRMKTVAAKKALADLLAFPALSILAINYEALLTKTAKDYLKRFLRKRRLMIVADEADDLGTPDSKRTRTALAAAKWGVCRGILTGTPAPDSPFGLYSMTNFLRPGLLGYDDYLVYKHRFAKWEISYANSHLRDGDPCEVLARNPDGSAAYQNLDELHLKLDPFMYRVTRRECGAALPSVSSRVFVLSNEARAVYDRLRKLFRAELEAGKVTAPAVLARYVRLQQVASGFVPLDREPAPCPACSSAPDEACPACEGLGIVLPEPEIAEFANPRLDALEREIRGTPGQTVVWTRFVRDAEIVAERLRSIGRKVARYDGSTSEVAKSDALAALHAGRIDDLVSNPQSAGRGLDFSPARTAIVYSHYWSLRMRLQMIDRIENLNRKDPSVVVDLIAEDTVDELIVDCHQGKRGVQDAITGDRWKTWL